MPRRLGPSGLAFPFRRGAQRRGEILGVVNLWGSGSELVSGPPKLSCQMVFAREPTRHAAVHCSSPRLSVTQNCITAYCCAYAAEKALKIAHFSKTGSRNMAETCAIDFSHPISYSTSIVIWGLRRLLLPFLIRAELDLENFTQNRSPFFAFVPIFGRPLQKK